MNLKDFDFVNTCVDYVNSFAPGTAKALELNTLLNDTAYQKYLKIIDMAVQLKNVSPEAADFQQKAESAKLFLKSLHHT